MAPPLVKGWPEPCSACGNTDEIVATQREYEPPGAFGKPAMARLWWKCQQCGHEWKQIES